MVILHSRRQLLARAGAIAIGAALMPGGILSPKGTIGRAEASCEEIDAVVVGSGYAGSIAALRLAQHGISSLVLERGRRWPITPAGDTFGWPPNIDGRISWLSSSSPFTPQTLDVYVGVLEAFQGNGISALAGAGVGGGSLVNNAVMMQPSRQLFRQSFGARLDYGEMEARWYPSARALIGVQPMPEDILQSSYYAAARSFADQGVRAGMTPIRADMAIDWQTVREEMAGTRTPSAIVGATIWGMNSGAKRSVDRTILAAAEATGRVTVQVLTRVVDIVPVGSRYVVKCELIDEQGNVLSRPQYSARHVFLAAGSLGTTRLLVRAKARGSLPALNSSVGTGWATGGDHQVVRVGMPYNNPTQGGPSGIVIQDASAHLPITMLNFPWPIPPADGTGAIGALAATIPPALGRFSYNAATDSVGLTWPATDPRVRAGMEAVTNLVDRLNTANPGSSTQFINADRTSHALGGAVIGSACRQDGSLIGYRNLHVIDSSLIPGSTGSVPPALTVAALADRCMHLAIRNMHHSRPREGVLVS